MGVRSSQPKSPNLNKTDGHLLEYFRNTFGAGGGANSGPTVLVQSGMTATGGIINDYTEGTKIYRSHVFVSTGTFTVTSLGQNVDTADNVEYLVIAGGGGGGDEGSNRGGGGGAGGYRTNVPAPIGPGNHTTTAKFTVTAGPTAYEVVVGGGGVGGAGSRGGEGGTSRLGPASDPIVVTSNGGGGGGQGSEDSPPANEGAPGGSGGGGGSTASPSATEPGGSTIAVTTPSPWPGPSTQGFAGGTGQHVSGSWAAGGGGGGAGEAGKNAANPNTNSSHGGDGLSNLIAGPTNTTVGVVNPESPGRWFAGGGAGIHFSPGTGDGGAGGGGSTSYPGDGDNGTQSTGGGGASGDNGGNGGSGIVIVRYQIGSTDTSDARATGGNISFYNGKTIHAFTGSGTFATEPNWSAADVEYVIVGGGGAGADGGSPGSDAHGGGGAGAYRTGTTPIGAHPVSTTIQIGGGAAGRYPAGAGTPSYFGTPITSPGGGSGGATASGINGGSGGGGSASGGPNGGGTGSGDTFPGTIGATPSNGWGNDGGTAAAGGGPGGGGGGGGGAGAVGADAPGPANPGGAGGAGMQLPSTFRDPASEYGSPGPTSAYTNGDTSGKYWVAGGGGGGTWGYQGPQVQSGGGGGGNSVSFAGGGIGGIRKQPSPPSIDAGFGVANTGGGGGGGAGGVNETTYRTRGRHGGSGLVLIAYPT